jgi:hypothetical protein
MAKFKVLQDLYRFPGLVPLPQVCGLFGDPVAVVITLQRRRKKRSAVSVVASIAHTTTNGLGMSAIFRVGTSVSTCSFRCAASSVLSVAA